MLKVLRFFTGLHRFLCRNWDKKTVLLISEDFRKVGTYILGIAFLGVVVQNDHMPVNVAFLGILLGGVIWLAGIFISKSSNKEDKE